MSVRLLHGNLHYLRIALLSQHDVIDMVVPPLRSGHQNSLCPEECFRKFIGTNQQEVPDHRHRNS
jgi:hypothetical protein